MFAIVTFIRPPNVVGCHKKLCIGNRRIIPKGVLTLIRNRYVRYEQILQVLSCSRPQERKMNSPSTDSAARGREEKSGCVLVHLNHTCLRVNSKVFGRGVALPL